MVQNRRTEEQVTHWDRPNKENLRHLRLSDTFEGVSRASNVARSGETADTEKPISN